MAVKLMKRPQFMNVKLTYGDMTYEFDAQVIYQEGALSRAFHRFPATAQGELTVRPVGLITPDYIGKPKRKVKRKRL